MTPKPLNKCKKVIISSICYNYKFQILRLNIPHLGAWGSESGIKKI